MLMSRLHHEPIPDIVLRAINDLFTSENGGLFVDLPGEEHSKNLLSLVWADREPERFVRLGIYYPALLTGAEKRVWQRIKTDDKYWAPSSSRGKKKQSTAPPARQPSELLTDVLLEDWGELRQECL
jgi:hypothetical protein